MVNNNSEEENDQNFIISDRLQLPETYIKVWDILVKTNLVQPPALKTYQNLLTYAYGKKVTCFPARERLAHFLQISTDTVDRHLKELRELKLISWVVRGNHKTNLYTLHEPGAHFYKAYDDLVQSWNDNKNAKKESASASMQTSASAQMRHEYKQVEDKQDFYHTTYEQAAACHAPSTIAYQAGSLKEAPKEQLQSLYANSTKEMFSLVSDLGLPPKYEPEEDSIAGISLKSSKTLSSLLKSYQKKDAKTRGWKYLEIDYLRAWEIVLPSVKASRFPNYTAQFKNEDGTIEFVGQKLAGQLKNLTDKNGYEFMKGYIEWCVFHWNQLRDKRKWMSNTPNILQIVKSFSTFSPFYQTGKITDYVPQKQVAEEKRERKVEEWIPPDEPGDLSKLFG